jgi:hypothetical protein
VRHCANLCPLCDNNTCPLWNNNHPCPLWDDNPCPLCDTTSMAIFFVNRFDVGLGFGLSLLVSFVVLYQGCYATTVLKVVRQPLVSGKIVRQSYLFGLWQGCEETIQVVRFAW